MTFAILTKFAVAGVAPMTFAILTKFAVAGVCSCDNRDSNRNPLLEFSLLQEQTPATAASVRNFK